MRYRIIAVCLCMACASAVWARPTYLGTGGPWQIQEFQQATGLPGVTERTITVGDHIPITDVNVTLPLAHTWSGDLIIELLFGGQSAALVSRIGSIGGTFGSSSQFGQNGDFLPGSGNPMPNYFNYIFDSQSTNNIWTAAAANPSLPGNPVGSIPEGTYATTGPGSVTPTTALNVFNGMDAFGVWTLRITDASSPNRGWLGNNWSLFIVPGPSSLALLGLAAVLGRSRRRRAN